MKRRPARREGVYRVIDGERDYQDSLGPERSVSNHDGTGLSVGDSIVLMDEYLRRAKVAYADNPGDNSALDVIRKVTAIGVRCMEEKGAVQRKYQKPRPR
jgi:hypothetical protein